MSLDPISAAYGAVASWRRRWYAGHPRRQHKLPRPVVSVGNVSTGGSGKTPLVAHLVQWLTARGERPVVLTRGYARQVSTEAVTVVSDQHGVRASLETAGDEPLWLARRLSGVPVVVAADRYQGGLLALARFNPTVFVLDDGFQHVALARDVDVVLISEDDLRDRPLPGGRLREPLRSVRTADLIVASAGGTAAAERLSAALSVPVRFVVTRSIGAAVLPDGRTIAASADQKAVAVAGIARPARFFDDLARTGWPVVEQMAFADHHAFTVADVDRIAARARAVGATIILTTEKDAVRFEAVPVASLPLAQVPLHVSIEPAADFDVWFASHLERARASVGRVVPLGERGE